MYILHKLVSYFKLYGYLIFFSSNFEPTLFQYYLCQLKVGFTFASVSSREGISFYGFFLRLQKMALSRAVSFCKLIVAVEHNALGGKIR